MTPRAHRATDDSETKHGHPGRHGPRAVPPDHVGVHVPKQGKGRAKPAEESAADVQPAPEPQAAKPQEPAEANVPVTVRSGVTVGLENLPPPGELPPASSLPQSSPVEQATAAPTSAQTLAPTVPVASPAYVVPSPVEDESAEGDTSHTMMLLLVFLVVLLGGGVAIAYFVMTQETNPLEGLF